jgi:putative MATE family efflux protein
MIVQGFLDDKAFFSTLTRLMVPIALQQLIIASLNLVSIVMVGQLGETAVASVGLANQVLFLFQLLLFGAGSGSAIFIAQFWGTRDLRNIRRVLGICLGIGLIGAFLFSSIALLAPELALSVYSTDPAVIALGSEYLRTVGLGYIAVAVTTSYSVALRSTGNVRLPVAVSIVSLSLGALLNYALIFGQFGLPTLGVQGSAIGTTAARFIECALLLSIVYSSGSVAAARLKEMLVLDTVFMTSVLKTILPVTANEILWSLGVTTYNLIYGRMGTESAAAVSIAATIENMALVVFSGLATACAIMIGHRIGAEEEGRAYEYARRFALLTVLGGIVIGSGIFLSADFVLGFYKIADTSYQLARNVLSVISLFLCIRASNMLFIVGILRAGGDTRASFLIDVGSIWLIGIPAAVVGAFVLQLPVYWVYVLAMSDEATKFVAAALRVFSKRWINNLAKEHASISFSD